MRKEERKWNRLMGLLLEFEQGLKDLQREVPILGPYEQFSIKAQEFFSMATFHSEPTVFIERLTRYAFINGGLGYLLIEEPEKPADESEEEEDNTDPVI